MSLCLDKVLEKCHGYPGVSAFLFQIQKNLSISDNALTFIYNLLNQLTCLILVNSQSIMLSLSVNHLFVTLGSVLVVGFFLG